MYYEEKEMGGQLYYRGSPCGDWLPVSNASMLRKLSELEAQLADARREAAEAQAREQTCRAAVREACENYEEVVFDDGLCACLPLEYISALNEEADLPDADPAALQSAIEQAVAEEREACAVVAENSSPRHTECGIKIARAIRARSLA